ncbi:MAG: prepilin-type N-terminal cleavage/methylation domain-containing protein [Phycisphaerales bacterium]|jgi:prepilin-type N-terminal cleavage/methylation domain-containing protein/prepilin-type processing-associated H-X9-DG protein|nr:prepilin-type N-terminal cleavage/methylation domain-containing protein [Phycisphaerales bacterium]
MSGRIKIGVWQTGRPERRGFTLIELLVVVAIIALLVALISPSLTSVFTVGRTTECQTRLKELAKAVTQAESAEGRDQVQPLLWQSTLAKYLDGTKTLMVCPEYAYIVGEQNIKEEPPLPLEDLAYFKVVSGSRVFTEPMGSGPWAVKLSDANYHKAIADGWLGNSSASNNFPRTRYEDGSEKNANPYWLCLEDHGGDADFKDVMIKVTVTDAGYMLECRSGFTGHRNTIHSKIDDAELAYVKSNTTPGSLPPITVGTTGIVSSYGMNIHVPNNMDTPGSVMLMDYHILIASSDDDWSDHPNPENSSIPVFARHSGYMNVLFVDGSVQMMDPEDINPDNLDTERAYWRP